MSSVKLLITYHACGKQMRSGTCVCMRTGWSFLSAFGRLWGLESWLLHGTHVADGDCRERELLLVLDAEFDVDRITEIFLGQLDDVVQQHCRHSHHHHQPEHFLESACSKTNSPVTGCSYIKNYYLHFFHSSIGLNTTNLKLSCNIKLSTIVIISFILLNGWICLHGVLD